LFYPNEAMMDGGELTRQPTPSPERVVATLLVAGWAATAFHIGGLTLAIRSTVLFGFPLLFIWLPGILVRVAGAGCRKWLDTDVPVSEFAVRLVGWAVIIGVPAAWWVFSQIWTG